MYFGCRVYNSRVLWGSVDCGIGFSVRMFEFWLPKVLITVCLSVCLTVNTTCKKALSDFNETLGVYHW